MKRILFLVLVLPNLLIGCYPFSGTDCFKKVKETYPDAEIYRVDKFEFILIDSVGLWYIDSNDTGIHEPHTADEPNTERELIKLWK